MMTVEKLSKMISVALGNEKADLVIKNAKIVNVMSGSFLDADIAIVDDYIVGVGDYSGKEEVDAKGSYATSGLIDAHVHIESSLCTPETFGEYVVAKGTTLAITDPHEIGNVCGVDGINYMIESAKQTPLKCMVMLPSCVPALDFEESGCVLDSKECAKLVNNDEIFGLAEMMNSPGLFKLDGDVLEKLVLFINANKIIDGHGVLLSDKKLNAYLSARITTDHECRTSEDAKQKLDLGMYVLFRHSTASFYLPELLKAVNPYNYRRCCMCTDDKHLDHIEHRGHVSENLKIAVENGIDPFIAVSMATLNPAECYGLKDMGLVAPGYKADIVLWDDLKDFNANTVFINGKIVAKDGYSIKKSENKVNNAKVINTINIKPMTLEDLQIKINGNKANVMRRVVQTLTEKVEREVAVDENGYFKFEGSPNLKKVAVIERHKATGHIGLGLIENFDMSNGAIATTIAHDSHNLIVIGDNDEDMLLAIKELERVGGGITIVKQGKVLETLELNIAGLISDDNPENIISTMHKLLDVAYNELGADKSINPFMTLSSISLAVIPKIRLTTKGLYDVVENNFLEVSL